MAASSATKLENSPIQQRIFAVLEDGKPHPVDDLIVCLNDSQATRTNVYPHIQALRRSLPEGAEIIVVQIAWKNLGYRLIRTYSKPNATPGWQTIHIPSAETPAASS